MKLTVSQCLGVLKNPRNRHRIELAKKQEERLVMHCEPILSRKEAPSAVNDFLLWVSSFLPKDKYQRFEQLLTFPFETVDTTKTIFDDLKKFFSAPDQSISFDFKNSAYQEEFMQYLENTVDSDFWETKGMDALRTGISSLIVVDLPEFQTDLRPQPYYYLLSICSCYDLVINEETGAIEYVAFWQKDKSVIFIDEVAYRKFRQQEQGGEWYLVEGGEKIHSTYKETINEADNSVIYGDLINGLGYTPVCSFYKNAISGSEGIIKKGPITTSLSKLDWLLFWQVSKKYLDLYGAWPIVVSYKEECTYRDENGHECREGYVNFEYEGSNGQWLKGQKECPSCKNRGVIGAGSFWTVDPPRDKDDVDLMQNPVKFIEVSNDKLEYGVAEMERLEKAIKINATGYYQEATKDAINEKQVYSQYEGRKAILDTIREQFEEAQEFVYETMAKLRYDQFFLKANVFLGKEYFLQSPTDLVLQYTEAKKAGLPMYEVAKIRETYSKTKFKNDPGEFQRAFILSQLEPYPDQSIAELKALGLNEVDLEGFYLKLDFANFIARFEREQMNVVEFGSLLSFDQKISIIKSKLLQYVSDLSKKASSRIEREANAGPAGGSNSA